jgi:putative IMPACT (imprinted ancient) family translation regulator
VTEYYSDDGEPAGTAGKPILGSISRQNLTNTLVVVTRYFGGIKLGVRGLIEAYGSTATEAIRMSGIVQRIVKFTYKIVTSYERIKSLNRLISQLGATE